MKQLSKEDEFAIVRQVLNGNKGAYRLLVNQYERYVFSAVLPIVGVQHAEDIAQEAFLNAFYKLEQFTFQSKFGTWLYRIAVNAAISFRRKQKFHSVSTDDVQINATVNNQQQIQLTEQQLYIQEAFKHMSEDDVTLLTLFYLDEMSLNEIAEIVELEMNNVKVKLYRARKRMAEQLQTILKEEAVNLY